MAERLSKEDMHGFEEFTNWIVLSAGEGHQPAESREDAIASAKYQAEANPPIIIAVYQLVHLVSARVQPPKLFEPIPDTPKPSARKKARP
jgi:hypothetical protein